MMLIRKHCSNNMKKIFAKRIILHTLLLWGFVSFVSAQSLSVQTEATGVEGMPAVKVDDTWNVTAGASIKFTLTFTKPELTGSQSNLQIESVSCQFNGETKEGTKTDSNTFTFVGIPSNEVQMASFSLTYSYNQKNDKGKDEKITPAALTVTSEGVRIWETPTCTVESVATMYTTSERVYKATPVGGSSNWTYSWNGVVGESSYTEKKPSSLPGWVKTQVEIKNYAPDGSTEWFTYQINTDTYFYNEPIIEKKSNITKTNFYKSTEELLWEVQTKDGGAFYEISWSGGANAGTGTTYSPYPNEVTTAQVNKSIQAEVVNKADDGHELYRKVITFDEINVYPSISYESGRTSVAIYSGEQVQFAPVNVQGGFPNVNNENGWVYSWSNGSTEQQMSDTPTATTTYTLLAQNLCNGEIWDSFTETYTANVYPIPSFKTIETMNIVDAKGKTNKPSIEGNISYPETSTAEEDYHLIVGDEINVLCNPSDGVPEGWSYDVYVNDIIAGFPYNLSSAGTYTVKVVAKNGEGIVEHPYTGTITRKYVVYDKPQFANTTNEIHTFSGESASFNAPVTGGSEDGWTFVWNDGTIGPDIHLDGGIVTKKTTEVHSLNATYVCEGITRFDDSESFTLVVWPQPKTTGLTIKLRDKELNKVKNIVYFDKTKSSDKNISIDCYDGDTLDISYNVEGGYTAENGCWTYQKSTDASATISYTAGDFATGTGTDTFIASNASQASLVQTFNIIIKNAPNRDVVYSTEDVWLNDQYKVNVKVWHKPSITEINTDSASTAQWKKARIDVYAGGMDANKVALNVPYSYGNTNNGGWVYSWKEDGKETSQNLSTWTYVPQSTSKTYYTDKTLSLHVVNKIGDNYGLDETLTYPIRVWNKAIFDTAFTITDNNKNGEEVTKGIREGNVSTYKVNRMDDGYFLADSTSYVYDWTLNGKAADKKSAFEFYTAVTSVSKDKGMVTKDVTDELVLYNYGPYGHVWEQHKLPNHSYRVYHKPQTPASIAKKGNFTTGTFAVNMPKSISDSELNTYQYKLVFGYVDASGNDNDISGVVEQGGIGTVRWYQVPTSARSYSNYYVYAEWAYTDGAKITSGKRYLSPKNGSNVDEEWDGSTFDSVSLATRAFILGSDEATEIQEITPSQENGDGINNRVYSLNGQLIEDTNQMESGIYLFEAIENGQRIVKKVIVK